MDRSRKGNPPSNVLAFRIPERSEAPKLPPANAGAVVAFKRPVLVTDPFEKLMLCCFCQHSGNCPERGDSCPSHFTARPLLPTNDWTPGAHLVALGRS